MKKILFLFAAAYLLFGCSTELEVNAPYKDITIVYGLLNQREDTHFVKINKAFLGEGDAYVYAMIQDSNEYRDEDITRKFVHRLGSNGQPEESFELQPITITDRLPGDFYSPEQTVYYFTHPASSVIGDTFPVYLDQNKMYELDLVVKGKEVKARTTIVNNFAISSVNLSESNVLNLYGAQGYQSYTFRWNTGVDGKRYEVSWRFNYIEVTGTDSIQRSITRRVASRVAGNTSTAGEEMEIQVEGEDFFRYLSETIQNDPAVDQRIFTGLDFLIAVANDEFHTALALNEPISGIIEERPAYSNVENGYGIFASRYTKELIGKEFGGQTDLQLINGPYTGNLNFCVLYPGEPIFCD